MVKQIIEECKITFKNFSGRPDQYNREGDRNFSLLLDKEVANKLAAEGWAVKFPTTNPNLDNEDPVYAPTLKVKVNARPSLKVYLVEDGIPSKINHTDIDILDDIWISYVDASISAYDWTVNGNSGRSAYLDELYVIPNRTELSDKYGV